MDTLLTPTGRVDPFALRKRVLQVIQTIPPLPREVFDLFHILCTQRACESRIDETLEHDAILSSQVIQVANSPLYPRMQRVRKLAEAATVLGMRRINALILANGLAGYMRREFRVYAREQGNLWRHSLCVAGTAR